MSLVKCIDCTFATVDGLCLYKGAYTPLHSDACESFQPRDDVQSENAKLRDEFRKMNERHSKELIAAMGVIAKLRDENAKLRGLAQDMWHDRVAERQAEMIDTSKFMAEGQMKLSFEEEK